MILERGMKRNCVDLRLSLDCAAKQYSFGLVLAPSTVQTWFRLLPRCRYHLPLENLSVGRCSTVKNAKTILTVINVRHKIAFSFVWILLCFLLFLFLLLCRFAFECSLMANYFFQFTVCPGRVKYICYFYLCCLAVWASAYVYCFTISYQLGRRTQASLLK